MIEWAQKRDGRVVPFNAEKIADAIFAAAKAVGGEDRRQAEFLAGQVIHLLSQLMLADGVPQVEQIQDLVEKVLIEHGHARTAKAYILYRNRRTRIREQKSELMDAVSEVLKESGVELPQYSTPMAKLQRIALAASEQYALNNLLPREFANAHQRAAIHIEQLANYSMSISALCIRPHALLGRGFRLGHTFLPPATSPEQLAKVISRLVVLAQNEVLGELLFADLDQAFAEIARSAGVQLDSSMMQPILENLLAELDIALTRGTPSPMRVCFSIGLDRSPEGKSFSRALLAALAKGSFQGAPMISPQVVYQHHSRASSRDDDSVLPSVRAVALQRGNPSFVQQDELGAATFASGLRLPQGEPGLVARTLINLPRIALEAVSSGDFWSGIDGILSLATRQLVHRYEVLSALPVRDLPLLLGDGLWDAGGSKRAVRDLLQAGQLSLIPVGIPEALQVARLRFGTEVSLSEIELTQLLRRIVEHWGSHYALHFELGQTASAVAPTRFLAYDQHTFPLARSLWPGQSTYSRAAFSTDFAGGQFSPEVFPANATTGVVYMAEFAERRCSSCGMTFSQEICPQCDGLQPIVISGIGGYLHSV